MYFWSTLPMLFSSNGYVFGRINLKLRTSPIHTIPLSFTSIKTYMLKCDNVWDKKSPQAITPLTVWPLLSSISEDKCLRSQASAGLLAAFPSSIGSNAAAQHTVVSKEKPRKGHLWTLLTRRRQVSSPAPATMIFHQHWLHRHQLHCHQTYQPLRCSHHLPKLNDLFLTLEKSLDGWSSNPQHSKYPVCPFSLFAGLRLTRIFKNHFSLRHKHKFFENSPEMIFIKESLS